jgi:hypothetical protein
MKKVKFLIASAVTAVCLSSCSMTTYMVTDNPVGTKTGVAKGKVGQKDADYSLEAACKKGKITKVGVVQVRYGLFSVTTTVTGE